MKKKFLFFVLVVSGVFTSCIFPKKYNELVNKETTFENTLQGLNKKIETLENNLAEEKDARIKLEQDTIKWANEYEALNFRYLNNISGETSETKRFIRQIDDAQREIRYLRRRIDEQQRSVKINELATTNFIDLVNTFVMSFPGGGVRMTSGLDKVTLTVDDALLFEPGGYLLTVESAEFLSYLSTFLARNSDVTATVVGNTDPRDSKDGEVDVQIVEPKPDSVSVEAKEGEMLDESGENDISAVVVPDNFEAWELSVMRSLEIVREIFKNKGVDRRKVIAAGRGGSNPVAYESDDISKSSNRRTQIILTK